MFFSFTAFSLFVSLSPSLSFFLCSPFPPLFVSARHAKSETSNSETADIAPFFNPAQENFLPDDPYSVYNETLAKQHALYAAAAYSHRPQLCPYPTPFNVTHYFHHNRTKSDELFGYAAVDQVNERIILAFRGTSGISQLKDELLKSHPVMLDFNSKLRLNSFFYSSAQNLYEATASAVNHLTKQYPTYQVHITGHSLGAALAVVSAFNLIVNGVLQHEPVMYTFGCPRVGNRDFAEAFSSLVPHLFRVTHARDLVPHIPPCPKIKLPGSKRSICGGNSVMYYSFHHGTEVWYPSDMPVLNETTVGEKIEYRLCSDQPLGEDPTCSISLGMLVSQTSLTMHRTYFSVNIGNFCPKYRDSPLPQESCRVSEENGLSISERAKMTALN